MLIVEGGGIAARRKENIHIAGPGCFYADGPGQLSAMKEQTEFVEFGVTLPNDRSLSTSSENLRHHADSIFENLKQAVLDAAVILVDLKAYRGSEPDSGIIFEIGMAYAKGAECYGFTRDERPRACKDQRFSLRHGVMMDEHGREAPYQELLSSPCVIGSARIVEGGFDDRLKLLILDLEREEGQDGMRGVPSVAASVPAATVQPLKNGGKPTVCLSGPERYDLNGESIYDRMKEICSRHGLEAYGPLDWADSVSLVKTDSPYTAAANQLDDTCQHVRDCDTVVANLSDFRDYECSDDVEFEYGMALQLGKKFYGYMDDTRPMKDHVPYLGAEQEYRDMTGANVGNFDYPLSLMFSCSMKIWEGRSEEIVEKVAAELLP